MQVSHLHSNNSASWRTDAGIKLSAVGSDITGVSGRLMLQALSDGQRDPAVRADLAKGRLRDKLPELTEALTGRFADHHAFLARMYLEAIDQRSQQIADLTARIELVIEPFRSFCDLIRTIPGIGVRCAEVIAAETGADLSIFPTTAAHLASWAGTCPGSNESAGRIKSTTTRPGNPYLKAALGAAALSIANTHGTYLAAKYRRIAPRRGPKKALVAVEHAILIAIWNMAPHRSRVRTTTSAPTTTPAATPNSFAYTPCTNSSGSATTSHSARRRTSLKKGSPPHRESSRQSRFDLVSSTGFEPALPP